MTWVRVTKWVLGIFISATLALTFVSMSKPLPEGRQITARVVRFGTTPSRFRATMVRVVAKAPDGRMGYDVVPWQKLRELNCKVGDPVDAEIVGISLVVDARTCGKAKELFKS
jgi:hypothetical protein